MLLAVVSTLVLVLACFVTDEEGNRAPIGWIVLAVVAVVATGFGYRNLRAALRGRAAWWAAGVLLVPGLALVVGFAFSN